LKLLGIAPFRAALEEKLALTRWATEALREIPDVEILAEPQLSIVAFRLHPPAWEDVPAAELNRRNRELLDRINARKRVMLTGTLLGDRFALRICVVSFRTHQDRMEACLEDIRAAVADIR
jgi:aromatic-L-amino-acid decarboxylase